MAKTITKKKTPSTAVKPAVSETAASHLSAYSDDLQERVAVVYPHHLFHGSELIANNSIVYLVEDPLFFKQYAFHRQKLMLHRSSMKRFADELVTKQKKTVRYVEAAELKRSGDIVNRWKKDRVKAVQLYDLEDDWLRRRLTDACRDQGIALHVLPSLNFVTPTDSIEASSR